MIKLTCFVFFLFIPPAATCASPFMALTPADVPSMVAAMRAPPARFAVATTLLLLPTEDWNAEAPPATAASVISAVENFMFVVRMLPLFRFAYSESVQRLFRRVFTIHARSFCFAIDSFVRVHRFPMQAKSAVAGCEQQGEKGTFLRRGHKICAHPATNKI